MCQPTQPDSFDAVARLAFHEASDGLLVFRRRDGQIVAVNPAAERLTGLTAPQLCGQRVSDLFSGEHGGEWSPPPEGQEVRAWLARPDRPPAPVRLRGCPIPGGETEPLGLLLVREAASVLAIEEASGRQNEVLQTIFDNIPVMITFLDRTGRHQLVNRAYERALGWSLEEIRQHPNLLAAAYPDPDELRRVRDYILHPTPGRWEDFRTRTRDGSFLDTSWSNVRLSDGTSIGFGLDVTERKRAEEERAALSRKLQETQRLESLGVLAGGVAHDFNNLLTVILGCANLAEMELPSDSPLRSHLGQIEHAARRAADLCQQMLAYAGQGRFVISPIDLNSLVSEIVDLCRRSIPTRITLTSNLAPDLPPIQGDANQVRQVLVNLLTNSSEAIGNAEGAITITTGLTHVGRDELGRMVVGADRSEGEYVFLELQDTGCGMDEATRERIFDPFFTTKFVGRGLGLSAVLGIVRGHQGALRVESMPGRGSTFRLLFPRAESPAPLQVGAEPGSPRQGTVLVVDDEEGIRKLVMHVLRARGFDTLQASDGFEALKLVRAHPEDVRLVLLDLNMPGLNGEETLVRLHRMRPDLPVLIMSGYSETELDLGLGGLDAGGGPTAFLQKPFTPSEMMQKVEAILNKP